MPVFYCPDPKSGMLAKDESRHVLKVLRHAVGDLIDLVDGRGGRYRVRINGTGGNTCQFEVESSEQEPEPRRHIHIAIAPVKSNDRNEFFIEKCVEIGVQEISFIRTANSERPRVNMDRAMRTSVAAMKQSAKARLPKFNELTAFKDFIAVADAEHRFIAWVDLGQTIQLHQFRPEADTFCCLIGPEGDFSPAEVELARKAGFLSVGLGSSVLRTETAGIVACTLLNFIDA